MSDIDPGARLSRTQAGNTELQTRARKLPQRLRTLLLLVDGKRSAAEVSQMAVQAGAPADGLEILMSQGFVQSDAPSSVPLSEASTTPSTTPITPVVTVTQAPLIEQQLLPPTAPAQKMPSEPVLVPQQTDEAFSLTPALEAPATLNQLVDPDPILVPPQAEESFAFSPSLEAPATINKPVDPDGVEEEFPDTLLMGDPSTSDIDPIESFIEEHAIAPSSISNFLSGETRVTQARMLLLTALKKDAPVAGAMLSVRVSRAKFREDLLELLDDIASKLAKSDTPERGARIIEQARELLTL